ncbi:hypothetical protein DFS33DRAFT_1382374 [Desarmillaria ectypa]|nr:hypothetical protein DFS33DRAFT_1382374 [Desarmillaria ectypa]
MKDQGNVYFKAGRLEEAAKLYGKVRAEKLGPNNAIYPPNLGTAYYNEPHDALAVKLVTRLSNASSCGVQSGSIMLKDLEANLSTINEPRVIAETTSDPTSNSNVSPELEAQDVRSRFTALPFGIKITDTGLEYYTVGQDPPMSVVHDLGPPDGNNSLGPDKLSEARLSCLALLWGSAGDKALARDLCLLFLIEGLISMRSQEENKLEEAEIKATILDMWTGFIMPAYCQTWYVTRESLVCEYSLRPSRFKKIVTALLKRLQESPPNLPAWIYITEETIPGIIDALKYWDIKTSHRNTKDMLHHLARTARTPVEHSQFLNSPGMVSNFLDTYYKLQEKREQLNDFVDVGLSEEQAIDMASKIMPRPMSRDPQWRKKWLANECASVVNLLFEDKGDGQTRAHQRNELIIEEDWYQPTQCFIPPAILRSRHEGFDELWGIFTEEEKGKARTPRSLDDKVRNHIETTWEPNTLLFARTLHFEAHTLTNEDPYLCRTLARNQSNPSFAFQWANALVKNRNMNARINQDYPTYSVISVFFDVVVDALIASEGRILLELNQDDIFSALRHTPRILPLPCQSSADKDTRRRMKLDPWRVGFETILALSYEALPFPMVLPSDFARCQDDIGILEVPFFEFMFDTAMSMAAVAHGVKQAVLRQIAEGKLVKKGDVYALTSVETLNASVVRWRMSETRGQAMKAVKWCFVAHRFDSDASGIPISSISSQGWVEMNPMRRKLLA